MSANRNNPFYQWVRLEQPRLGTRVVWANDEFFGAKERLIEPTEPVFIPDKYDEHGKWMDGWETRRRREPGHDSSVVRLGVPGVIRGLEIDTRHFTGNYPPQALVEACQDDSDVPAESAWRPLTPMIDLAGNSQRFVNVDSGHVFTHVRLNIFPDGGVARLRIYGEVRPDWSRIDPRERIDLFALENGGRALLCNDEHFGSMHNLNLPGRGVNMGDGWETARRRRPGNDWVIVALGHAGTIEEVEIDTAHFKGNYPDRAKLQAGRPGDLAPATLAAESEHWPVLLPETRLGPDARQLCRDLAPLGAVTHVRLSIFPDGGVSRLRLFGYLERKS
ncbi:MAG: allantoicase [Gammaproteobacteria bacterium]|nr:allantoicase [Gammaproteobacteria bacterium]MDH4256663.1 allantoicase [Gammaproteobacteria bacterium]MDH5309251.1 allantoicase [Gammaproteobacteria bacterium]